LSDERVIVIGAGLSGLAVAARLHRAGRDVLVLEGNTRTGGQIQTFVERELVVELGAEGFVARSSAVPELCRLVDIEASLVDQLTTDTYCLEGGALVLLPPGEAARRLGFQVPEEELGRGIRSLGRGMGQLIDALLAQIEPARVRLGAPVAGVRQHTDGLQVGLVNGSHEICRALVCAVPARAAAPLLEPLGLEQTAPLAEAGTTSNVSVNLLYHRQQFPSHPTGSGMLFPDSFASVGLRAASFVDRKFPGRAPVDRALLRVFFRPTAAALRAWDDARFAGEASAAIAQLLGVSGAPERTWVSRWIDALPIFSAGYRSQVAQADAALQALGVHVTGSSFHGAGIDAAVTSASVVAARLSP
jgi:oxygen-dependent protoporphyrinogen oxidase